MPNPRLLFILSNDYGELASALRLVTGQPFDVHFLIPARLFTNNGTHLPFRASRYSFTRDLIAAIKRERPDVVLLFSAYLFGINGLFQPDELETLIREIRQAGAVVLTTDPFLGVMSSAGPQTFSDAHPQKPWLIEHFSQLHKILHDVVHLYPVDVGNSVAAPHLSCFNDKAINSPSQPPPGRPGGMWLFILSLEDNLGEVVIHGKERFESLLRAQLVNAINHGRRPMLLAPKVALERMKADPAITENAMLLDFCPHHMFLPLLLLAEHVFYWNIVSNSILDRVLANRPVLFFDAGHVLRAIPGLREPAMQLYYKGIPPLYLDPFAPLAPPQLAARAADQLAALAPAIASIKSLPRPPEMIQQLLER